MTWTNFPGNPKEGSWECRPGPGCSDWDFYEELPTLTRKGVDYIRSRRSNGQPFFLYFPLPSPHAPIIPTDAFDGRSGAGAYGDYVVQTDDACGQLLAALREVGLEKRTIVLFTSDNGAEHYAYARDQEYDHWSSAPFRGVKRDLYEGGHHVPFLIKWPGVTKPGTVSDALLSQVDLMATFAALLNYKLPRDAAADSFDFLPWLQGKTNTPPRTSIVHNTKAKEYAIRSGDWLLVNARTGYTWKTPPPAWDAKHHQSADDDQQVELYNLHEDVGQRHNLAANHPAKVAELQALLKKLREQGHSAPRLE
jgi:arylsulfatase A